MLTLKLVRLAILQTALFATAQAQTCYFTNGQPADSTFKPCFPDQPESACCSLAKSNDVPDAICLTGGFCYQQDPYYRGVIRQGACTDATWNSPSCPSLSHTAWHHGLYVMPCPVQGRGFWCASNGTYCCDDAVRKDMGQLINVTVTSFSGAASSYPSLPAAASPTPTSLGKANPSQAASTATCASDINSPGPQTNKAAAGVGAALGACLLIALIALFAQRRSYVKKMREREAIIEEKVAIIETLSTGGPQLQLGREMNAEKRVRRPPVELESEGTTSHEVDGDRW